MGGIRVHITGASGQWVRIDHATEEEVGIEEKDERTLFSGEGWVYGPLLEVGGTSVYYYEGMGGRQTALR